MRITTKVIQNNSLSNINTNKLLQDKLNNQMASEKKINRPSDDPVVAIRALRLRTNVSQITQYYEKNSKDAESWLSVTEDALSTVSAVIEDLIEQVTTGANENRTSIDRNAILDALSSLRNEVYATGNADYAGRSIFTGYRTESSLKFKADTEKKYCITEQITGADIDVITHVSTSNLNRLNDANFNDDGTNGTNNNQSIKEQDVVTSSIYRIRLSYQNVDGPDSGLDANGEEIRPAADKIPTIKYYDAAAGAYTALTDAAGAVVVPDVKSVNEDPSPYENIGDDDLVLIKETGELLMGKNIYNTLKAQEDNVNTAFNESSLLITYEKSDWEKDDLKPEHYFNCEDMTDKNKKVVYNSDYIVPGKVVEKQAIEYDVGMNQTIRVNTTADEVFTHAIGRDVDDLISAMQEVVDMEATVKRLESMAADAKYTEEERKTINKQLDAANKALTYLDEKAQKLYESSITKMQAHLDKANLASTNCGTRGMKLELIQNRLSSQKTNFEDLESENENVDVTEVAVKLSSAELTYEAALMATGKILQTSLMNYI